MHVDLETPDLTPLMHLAGVASSVPVYLVLVGISFSGRNSWSVHLVPDTVWISLTVYILRESP